MLGGLLLLPALAPGLEKNEQTVDLSAFVECRAMYADGLRRDGVHDAGLLAEGEGGVDLRWYPHGDFRGFLAATTLAEWFVDETALTQTLKAGVSVGGGRDFTITGRGRFRYLDDPDPESSLWRGGGELRVEFRGLDAPVFPSVGYRFGYGVYYETSTNPTERTHNAYFQIRTFVGEKVVFLLNGRYAVETSDGSAGPGGYFGHGPELLVLLQLGEGFTLHGMARYELRRHWADGDMESKTLSSGMEWFWTSFLAVSAGIDYAAYSGAAAGPYRNFVRIYAGLRIEV
jgi:hypothetical protein